MRSPRVLAVDLGAERAVCGRFARGADGRLVLEHLAWATVSSAPEMPAGALIARLVCQASRGMPGRAPVRIALPGHLTLTRFVKTPSVALPQRAKALAFEAAENIPYPLSEVAWDGVVLSDDGLDLEIMLAAVKRKPVETLCGELQRAGHRIEHVMPAAFALRDALRYNHRETADAVALVESDACSTHVVLQADERFACRTFPFGGRDVKCAPAADYGLSGDAAEAAKSGPATASPVEGRLASERETPAPGRLTPQAKWAAEISRSILHLRRQTGIPAPTAVFISGEASWMSTMAATVAAKMELPVHPYDPLRNVNVSPEARLAGARECAASLGRLVGIAAEWASGEIPRGNLLPPGVRLAAGKARARRTILVTAALALLAGIPPIARYRRLAEMNRQEFARIDAELSPLRRVRARNADNLDRLDAVKREMTAWGAAYRAVWSWRQLLEDLQAHLVQVEDVWLDRLKVLPAAPESRGQGASSAESPVAPVRLALSGRLLDVANPQSRVSPQSVERVKRLLASLRQSRFVADLESERFDNAQDGLLRFEVTLVLKSSPGL